MSYCTTGNTKYGKTTEERFWSRVEMIPFHTCWEWMGLKSKEGYGVIGYKKKAICAHRVSYLLHGGKEKPGFELDHLCRNPSCVNPNHLELVTKKENVLRGFGPTAINKRKTHCIRGHEFTKENTGKQTWPGARSCKKCNLERSRKFVQKKKDRINLNKQGAL